MTQEARIHFKWKHTFCALICREEVVNNSPTTNPTGRLSLSRKRPNLDECLAWSSFYDLFEHWRVWLRRGSALPVLGCICEHRGAWVGAGRSLSYYWQWVPAGCDLRRFRQTFKIDDNMFPRRMSRQREKQHTQQPRQEQKVTDNISFPEMRASPSWCLLPCIRIF